MLFLAHKSYCAPQLHVVKYFYIFILSQKISKIWLTSMFSEEEPMGPKFSIIIYFYE